MGKTGAIAYRIDCNPKLEREPQRITNEQLASAIQLLRALTRERQHMQDLSRKAGPQLFDRKPDRDAGILELLIRNM